MAGALCEPIVSLALTKTSDDTAIADTQAQMAELLEQVRALQAKIEEQDKATTRSKTATKAE
ncbi:tail tubular protein B [Acinetobacter virus vB_AbaP_AGC01]|uniref:Tail tubular protein B n=1 Tax=Acinetobacter virus vB_AbaP_AGC01 TaxID=2723754 RepID=A0A6H0X2M6_9CAUD|nr:tail tubular protein B [Acinetobacter virus vB_AbaP_AGC01]